MRLLLRILYREWGEVAVQIDNMCYYTFDEIAGRVLIPGCMAVAHMYDIEFCTCNHLNSWKQIEHKKYQSEVKKLNKTIETLLKENTELVSKLEAMQTSPAP